MTGQDGAAPPIALQFEELLSELKGWESQSEASEEEGVPSDSDEEPAAMAPAAQYRTRGGRSVDQRDYKE